LSSFVSCAIFFGNKVEIWFKPNSHGPNTFRRTKTSKKQKKSQVDWGWILNLVSKLFQYYCRLVVFVSTKSDLCIFSEIKISEIKISEIKISEIKIREQAQRPLQFLAKQVKCHAGLFSWLHVELFEGSTQIKSSQIGMSILIEQPC
jgi:hypothetical protein